MDSWIYFVASLLWIISNETWTTSRTCVCMLLHFDLESLISESYFFRCEFLMFMKSMMILIFFWFHTGFFAVIFFLWPFFLWLIFSLAIFSPFFDFVFLTLYFWLCFFVFDFVIIFSHYNFSFAFQTLIFFFIVFQRLCSFQKRTIQKWTKLNLSECVVLKSLIIYFIASVHSNSKAIMDIVLI